MLPRQRRTRAVLAILALAAPAPVRRDRLIALLWPRRGPEQARASLRQALYELRVALRPLGAQTLACTRDDARLAAPGLRVDAKVAPAHRPDAEPTLPPLAEDLAGLEPAFDAWREAEHRRLCAAVPRPAIPITPPLPPAREPRLRLGILPLRLIGAPAGNRLADTLAAEIAVSLGRSRALAVRPSLDLPASWTGPSTPPDVVLDGVVQAAPAGVSVTLRLLDLRADGEMVWAQRYEHAGEGGAAFAAEIAATVAAQAELRLLLHEGIRPLPADPTAFHLLAAAIPAFARLQRGDFLVAGARLRQAVACAPDYAAAHAWLAWWHALLVGQGWADDTHAAVTEAEALATRAATLDPLDARALAIAGYVRSFLGHDPEDAGAFQDRALAVDPNLPLAWALSGLAHAFRGDHAEAIRRIGRAKLLSPFDPLEFFFESTLAVPHAMIGDYEHALLHARAALRLNPHYSSAHKGALVALGHLGRADAARPVAAMLRRLEPDFSVRRAVARSPLLRRDDRDRYAEGLRRAGLPD